MACAATGEASDDFTWTNIPSISSLNPLVVSSSRRIAVQTGT